LSKQKFAFDSVKWQLPDEGSFVFDIVLPRMPLNPTQAADDILGKLICKSVLHSPCNFKDRLKALRLVAHRLVLTPDGLVEMLRIFPSRLEKYPSAKFLGFSPRVECYILLYNRTLYHGNVVSPRVLYHPQVFRREEVLEIRSRLGWIHTFDLVNLHSEKSNLGTRHGPMDMSTNDGCAIVKAIISVSQTEGNYNFTECHWSERDAMIERGYAFHIPKDWVPNGVPNPPQLGAFSCTFCSVQSEVNYGKRRDLASRFLGWTYSPDTNSRVSRSRGPRWSLVDGNIGF